MVARDFGCGAFICLILMLCGLSYLIDSCENSSSTPPVYTPPTKTNNQVLQGIENTLLSKKNDLHKFKNAFRNELIKNPWDSDEMVVALSGNDSEVVKEPWFSAVKVKWDNYQSVLSYPFDKIEKSFWNIKNDYQKSGKIEENYVSGADSALDELINASSDDIDVQKAIRETLAAIPRLKLESGELPELPGIDKLFKGVNAKKKQAVLELVKNKCSVIIKKANVDTDEYLKQSQFEAACYRQLDAIKALSDEISKLDDSLQRSPMDLLNKRQSNINQLLCRPHQETINSCRISISKAVSTQVDVLDLWERILDSLDYINNIYPEAFKENNSLREDVKELKGLLEYFETDQKDKFSYIREHMDPFIKKCSSFFGM